MDYSSVPYQLPIFSLSAFYQKLTKVTGNIIFDRKHRNRNDRSHRCDHNRNDHTNCRP